MADKGSRAKGSKQFLIKWKGYSEEGNTWEPIANLQHYSQAITEYKMSKGGLHMEDLFTEDEGINMIQRWCPSNRDEEGKRLKWCWNGTRWRQREKGLGWRWDGTKWRRQQWEGEGESTLGWHELVEKGEEEEQRQARQRDEEGTTVRVHMECKHGFVLISGMQDDALKPVCTSARCRQDGYHWLKGWRKRKTGG